MGVAGWGLGDWALIALNVGLSVSLPIITRLKLATSARLREAVLYSKPGRIAAWTVMLSGVACLSGLLFALLAVRYPVAWSSLSLAVGVLSAVLWYARRYHRTLQHMMRSTRPESSRRPESAVDTSREIDHLGRTSPMICRFSP